MLDQMTAWTRPVKHKWLRDGATTVEVVPVITKHNDGHVGESHYNDFIGACTQQILSSLCSSLDTTSARERWEDLLQAATRGQASSPAGRWSPTMGLVGGSQHPDVRKNAAGNIDWAGGKVPSTSGKKEVVKNLTDAEDTPGLRSSNKVF